MQTIDNKYLSTSLYSCKAMALLSVITAHTTMTLASPLANLIKQRLSSVGVIVFMILSGFLFNVAKYGSVGKFAKKKAISVCVPWLILGTVVYFWGQIHDFSWSHLSVVEWLKYVLGYKTFLYYIPMLLLCYMIFYRTNKPVLIIAMIMNVISLELTAFGLMDPVISWLHITNYLNVFNWTGFFALGILLREYDGIRLFTQFMQSHKPAAIGVAAAYPVVVVLIAAFVETDQSGYFSRFGFIMELFAFAVILILSNLRLLRGKVMMRVAGYFYSAYLIHTMVLSVVMYVPILNSRLSFLLPLVVLIVACVGLYVLEWISQRICCEKAFSTIFGIRVIKRTIES